MRSNKSTSYDAEPKHRPLAASRCGASALYTDVVNHLFCARGKFPEVATFNDFYQALACSVRDRIMQRWIRTAHTYFEKASRTVALISVEYLIGPQLAFNLINLGLYRQAHLAMRKLGTDLKKLIEQEEEPGLGNGGLGRLAACYLDSLATLERPAIGYGLRYEFGIFDQEIRDGWQVEVTDKWLRMGAPWEIPHPEIEYDVPFGGHTERFVSDGRTRYRWIPARIIRGTPHDTPVLGYGVNTANILRLWRAEAREAFDLHAFNVGEYYKAVERKVESENITRILYPNDLTAEGRKLRLMQEYFLVSCSLQDMIRIYMQRDSSMLAFHRKYVVQLNDTHPALAIAELMRILVDEYDQEWDTAWSIVTRTFAYTNHTLLPEALEKWPVTLLAETLPRHLEIIYEINRRFLDEVRLRCPGDEGRIARLSLVDEAPGKQVRMAHLACVGSFSVNGVSELHTRLLRQGVFMDFAELWPAKFNNKTNGISQRRFLLVANPRLAGLVTKRIGAGWITALERLRRLERWADSPSFQTQWLRVKSANKRQLAAFVEKTTGVRLDPCSIFDVHAKRIHEYKRQHLNALHIIALYNRICDGKAADAVPRSFIFAGKAAPGYAMAKLIIKLIHSVADVVNKDRRVRDLVRIAFVPDFNVKTAQLIYPAADLSEQISTAGTEASGTGNMKFALNGALIIGTRDGANIEIAREVGPENFFSFGLSAEEIQKLRMEGYRPKDIYEADNELRRAIDMISAGYFSRGDRELFAPLINSLLVHDYFMVLADFRSYVECQERVSRIYLDAKRWAKMSILNTARMGRFSSDRAVLEYCIDIWRLDRVPIRLGRIGRAGRTQRIRRSRRPAPETHRAVRAPRHG